AAEQAPGVYNYSRAVGAAYILNQIVELNVTVPHALFSKAHEFDPTFTDEGKWEWKYSHSAAGESYTIQLTASRASNNSVNWNFYVTNAKLGLSHRLFFSGQANVDGSQGTWNYYSLEDAPSETVVSTLKWKVGNNENAELRLEVTGESSGYQGDYIEYSYDGAIKHAAYFDSSKSNTIELQINTETQAGYLIAPDYNEGKKACWDESKYDTSCS